LIDHDQHRPVLLQPGEDLAQRGFILGQLAVIDSFSRASQRASMVVALAHVQAEPDGIFGCRIDHSILSENRPRSLELITTPAAGTHACKETSPHRRAVSLSAAGARPGHLAATPPGSSTTGQGSHTRANDQIPGGDPRINVTGSPRYSYRTDVEPSSRMC